MDLVKITFNYGSIHEYKKGTLFYEVSKDSDMENIVGFKINNEVFSLDTKVMEDIKINAGAFKEIGDQIKIAQSENYAQISKIQQKEQEKNGK